ncbi:LysR family transcriptional regulator [Mesorhizobium sp.]|uniref:helix-turn-helix domain-containing protein n=1 Tax=Mesorhizobium sp. TaxID=1871066 RepID=UPI000FE4E59D|nr:LysR family transcriptional regulator [Mesorhizobium sp.]RWE90949.1 MAG: LysR family transcriptional regulator [Mesorhizobium sp.]
MRIAIEVARLGSFTAASRELRLSAPSVSRIMGELEADFGGPSLQPHDPSTRPD